MNVQMRVHVLRTLIAHPLVHIHQKKEIACTRNPSKNCKCKRAFMTVADNTLAHLKNSAHICITLQFLSVSYVDFRKILRLCLNN